MKSVICNGTKDLSFHKCTERKCKHRKLHKSISGRCGCKDHNGADGWCVAPGTTSLIDGQEDGGLVTCMSPEEIKEETKSIKEYTLALLIKSKTQAKKDLDEAKNNYRRACKSVLDLKKRPK